MMFPFANNLKIVAMRFAIMGQAVDVNAWTLFVAGLTIYVASKVLASLRAIHSVGRLPGFRVPFYPLDLPGAVIPTLSWNPGLAATWLWRHTLYQRFQNENFSIVSFLAGPPAIYTSNLDVARQVAVGGHKVPFVKPERASQALLLWGMNLIAADGQVWRKHRRVMGPAFSNELYQLVWDQTRETYNEMITSEGWADKKTVDIPVVQEYTFKLALLMIGRCGFGFSFNWSAPARAPDGSMSLQEALRVVGDTHMIAIILPKWVQKLPFRRLKEARQAHEQLMDFMQNQAAERKAEIRAGITEGKEDVFTMLVKANEGEAGKSQLDDEELIGNVFIMLFAGHETTAHALAATLGFLAVYDDIQEEVFQQITSVVGWERDPVFDDYAKLDKVLSAFYEALRLFPAGFIMIREATEDTVLQIPNPVGQEGTTPLPVAKGTQVIVDMVGVQYNPRYFDEPGKYKPSRWYGVSNESEAFSAFSVGPRACIGRKFATTEAVCFLTLLLRDWRIEPILSEGETKEAWMGRVLDAKIVITLGVADVPVRLVRRGAGP
ncbi:hypothetical protein K443DRAFT_674356 [Laccaria amethystina LaAM-08-1]|uniref:Cytochrome P450 n=1 Tax=Laccaria amethystina LaAM-08-1 TaxID=1095629 RepID=A0A0C9YDW4_9AGAR|nr:hypothetical protein K443DRAFT_674356 [Laccaria amethystina LaAM-08-1]